LQVSGYLDVRIAPLRRGDPPWLGEYELIGLLGQGGMGTVYLAHDRLGESVAVKVIRADLAADPEFRERFRREVQQARQVPPFCTAEVLDADPDHETPYLVVEYVDGPCLADVVEERGPLTGGNLHALAIGVATALTAIHGAGVVHRDLKPRNVLLAPGSPKVIDFGIARAMEATSQLTRTSQMLGTVAYMAPERFDSDSRVPLGPAADVFAWGAVIAYAGLARTPFGGDSPTATAGRILTQPPNLVGLAQPLRDLVALSLEKDPADRPTALDLLDMLLGRGSSGAIAGAVPPELRDAAQSARAAGGEVTPTPVTPYQRAGRHAVRPRSRWKVLAAAGAAATLVAGGSVLLSTLPDADPSAADRPVASAAPSPAAAQGTLVFRDDLAKSVLWQEESIKEGSCRFNNTIYLAKLNLAGYYLCDGPASKVAGDQLISVDVMLGRVGTCASVYLLRDGDDYYELETCADSSVLNRHTADDVELMGAFDLDKAVSLGQPTRVTLRVAGAKMEVSHGDRVVGEMPMSADDIRNGGEVTVGIYGDDDKGEAPFEAAFGHIEVRSLA
jgi:predicted Ser/Thr protein kinase